MDSELLDKLRVRALDPQTATDGAEYVRPSVHPRLTKDELDAVERKLGFALCSDLRQLYTLIGNGGFGPAYGLLGVHELGARNENRRTADELYLIYRERVPDDPHWSWPERLLPVGHLGCGMFMCVDCSSPEGQLIWFEPNPHNDGEAWDECFIPVRITLSNWLERWLDGTADSVFDEAFTVQPDEAK